MSDQSENGANGVFDPMWDASGKVHADARDIEAGFRISAGHYADQPYVLETADGGLLCVVTTGSRHEGSRGQHVCSMKSFDEGRTWQDARAIESPRGPESSWGVLAQAPGGRIFVFYVFNADDIRELPADNPPYPHGRTQRMDSHGHYVFRWSDDCGKSWSKERGVIPVREFAIDRSNPTSGAVRLFWNVGKPFVHRGALFLPIHKVGGFGEGWFTSSEGALLRSDDLLAAGNPLVAQWATLPDGEHGIRLPQANAPINEEHSFVALSDGSFFTVFRTIEGHPACAYSRDRGHTWSTPDYMCYANGRRIKNPRSANFVWKMEDGGYLYSFNNHGGRFLREHPDRRNLGYTERNPMWLCRGWEVDSPEGRLIRWAQPEIGLYADDPMVRISYPDFIQYRGKLLLTETQKNVARIHALPPELFDALSRDARRRGRSLKTLRPLLSWQLGDADCVAMPELPAFIQRGSRPPYGSERTRRGFSLQMGIRVDGNDSGELCACEGADGSRFALRWTRQRTLQIHLNDGQTAVTWESDPVPPDVTDCCFGVNVDGGSNVVSFYRDGFLNDGGDFRRFGWGRISPFFRNVYGGSILKFSNKGSCKVLYLKLFPRILTSAEIELLDEAVSTARRGSASKEKFSFIVDPVGVLSEQEFALSTKCP